MGTKFQQKGDVLTHTASGAISADDVIVIGDNVAVALVDIANGEDGSVAVEGVFEVAKATGTAWSQGDSLDFDASTEEFENGLSAVAGDVSNCAIAAEDAESGDALGRVKLTPGTGTAA